MRVVNDAGADACLVVCLVQTAPKNGLTVTDPMLTGDYAGARKVALALSWSSRLSDSGVAVRTGVPAQIVHHRVRRPVFVYLVYSVISSVSVA
ncbi:hypothetical protein PC118_g19406 [Phytophthora cactorum]|uniref:Uncharacterized protein n=1 Tax=Phytophthora cactorum TaxID=29920 RepID=A0A8T1F0P7_9STRA|nr:hypothetical protein PC118_g19406 [Phytophthora cactorum]